MSVTGLSLRIPLKCLNLLHLFSPFKKQVERRFLSSAVPILRRYSIASRVYDGLLSIDIIFDLLNSRKMASRYQHAFVIQCSSFVGAWKAKRIRYPVGRNSNFHELGLPSASPPVACDRSAGVPSSRSYLFMFSCMQLKRKLEVNTKL